MTACKWNGRGNPRTLPGRHGPECPETAPGADLPASECPGCLPCPERHCAVCARVHADGACPECIAATRDDLAAIRLMCGALPAEVEHRGVNGEAMMLLGPSADMEARQYVEASYLVGRLPEGWIETSHGRYCPTLRNEPCLGCGKDGEPRPDGEKHPLNVLGTWEMVYRDQFDIPSDLKVTVERAAAFLGRVLHRAAECEDVPFGDFARDVRGCRGHLEAVMHDQAQGDVANIGCFECGARLERKVTPAGLDDAWTCQRCRRRYTHPEYLFALRAALEDARKESA